MLKLTCFLLVFARVKLENCEESFQCVKFHQCRIGSDDILYPCHNNAAICCPDSKIISTSDRIKPSPFPKFCGLYQNEDKITGGETAAIGQFPWMALLGYKTPGINEAEFLCGGTLITERYVLTAAHCVNIPSKELSFVRLGEHDLTAEIDCDYPLPICADPYLEVPVEKVLGHEGYNKSSLENDIALIVLRNEVDFTDFIAPICLPFDFNLAEEELIERNYIICGWGFTDSGSVHISDVLQFARVNVWNHTSCKNGVPSNTHSVGNKQLCANGPGKEDACKGDSGGPLFQISPVGNSEIAVQFGIVSYKPAPFCGLPELPTIYTRTDAYLDWIKKNVV